MNEEVKDETTQEETSPVIEETDLTNSDNAETTKVETTLETTPSEEKQEPKKGKNKKKIIIISILVALLLIVVGVLLFIFVFNKKDSNKQDKTNVAVDDNIVNLKNAKNDGDFKEYRIDKIDYTKTYVLETNDRVNFNNENQFALYVNGKNITTSSTTPAEGAYIYTYEKDSKGTIVVAIDNFDLLVISDEVEDYPKNIENATTEYEVTKDGIVQTVTKINNGVYTNSYGKEIDICTSKDYSSSDVIKTITTYEYKNNTISKSNSEIKNQTLGDYLKENSKDDICSNREIKMSLYKSTDGYDSYYVSANEDYYKDYKKITSYTCNKVTCEGEIYNAQDSNYNTIKKYALILDDSKLYYYEIGKSSQFSEAKQTKTFTDSLTKLKLVTFALNDNEEYRISYLNNQNNFSNGYVGEYTVTYNENNAVISTTSNVRIVDMNNGKTLFEISNPDAYYGYASLTTEENGMKTLTTGGEDGLIILLTSDYKIIESTEYYLYSFYNNKLYFGDETSNKYYIYDKDVNRLKESKEYYMIYNVTRDFVSVITTDMKLQILKADTEEVVADFGEWKSTYYGHPTISGDYEENGKKGIYLVVGDSALNSNSEYDYDDGYGEGYEFYYEYSTGETGKISTYIGGYAKPVLYLYPEEDNTKVTVKFDKPSLLTTTYPKYDKSWTVTVNKDGNMTDSKGKNYYALYWEEEGSSDVDFSEGFYVTDKNAISFLEEKLDILGFTEREANEFIMYWLPILESNKKSLVYFELTDSREKYNKLNISPKPDSLLRVAIHVKKVDKKTKIKEEKLPTFNRVGFTAVEWGGVIH